MRGDPRDARADRAAAENDPACMREV